jgi:phosphopantetheinyl transferase
MERAERRSSSRLRIAEGWRKTVQVPTTSVTAGRLVDANVSIWIASTASLLRAKSALTLLTADDRATFTTFSDAGVRDSAIAARLLLRLALSIASDRCKAPQEWQFQRDSRGKPFVAGTLSSINFTVTHTRSLTAIAVSPKTKIGIDIELIDQSVSDDLISDNCSAMESRRLLSLPPSRRTREFIQHWTQKEAYSKLVGCGLSEELAILELGPTDDSKRTCIFEGFFIPVEQGLHYGSLAVAGSGPGPIDVSFFNVGGPGEASDAMLPLAQSA